MPVECRRPFWKNVFTDSLSSYTDCWLPVKQMMLNIIKTKMKTKLFFLTTFKSSFKKNTRFFWMKISNWRRSICIFRCTQAWPAFHSLPVHSLSVPPESQTKQERRDTAVHPWSHRQTSLFRPNTIHQALATFSHSVGELESYQQLHTTGGTSSHAACLFWWRCRHVIKAESQTELP